ncbi:unnamed protein product [Calypogeia fissa]
MAELQLLDHTGLNRLSTSYNLTSVLKSLYEDDEDFYSSEEEEEEDDDDDYDSEISEWEEDSEEEREAEYENALIMNRLMLVDEKGFPQLVQSLLDGFRLDSKNYLFRDSQGGNRKESCSDAFGINLGVGDKDNELGWLAYENEELVGFVYDGVYCDLEGKYFLCGDTEVEVPRSTSEYDESEDEFNEADEESEEQTSRPSLGASSSIKFCSNCSSAGGFIRDCYSCGLDGHVSKDCDGHGHTTADCPYPRKRKAGDSQLGQRKVRKCDHCHKEGHTRDRCFALHPRVCDYCNRDGHTRTFCFSLHPELRRQLRQRAF